MVVWLLILTVNCIRGVTMVIINPVEVHKIEPRPHLSTISDPVSNVWVDGAPGRTRIVKTSTDKWYMWGMNLDKYKIFGQTGDQATPVDVTSDFTTYFGAQGTSILRE